jgi:hypothetical protein
MDTKRFNELEELAKPLQDWLIVNFDPHCRVEITYDGVNVISGLLGIPMPVEID